MSRTLYFIRCGGGGIIISGNVGHGVKSEILRPLLGWFKGSCSAVVQLKARGATRVSVHN